MTTVSILGPRNTFSDIAFSNLNLDYEINYFNSIQDVLENIIEYGFLPIENALDGYINQILDELVINELFVVGEYFLKVDYSLVGDIKKIEDIKNIYVQFKALPQVNKFIRKINKPLIITESNIQSYDNIKKFGDAAIVPIHLKTDLFRIDNISDNKDNYTRFFLIKKKKNDFKIEVKDNKKALFMIHSEVDKAGLLLEILEGFGMNKMNLLSIISRPNKEKLGTYNFFIEVDIENIKEEDLNNLIKFLDSFSYLNYKILGLFKNFN